MVSDAQPVQNSLGSISKLPPSPMHMPHVQTQSSHRKACKECRRLRLGCDREVPCYNCKRRGCSAICPEGELSKKALGKLSNSAAFPPYLIFFVNSSRSTIIVELQETIAELRTRNFHLEEALRDMQALLSRDPHPLLREKKKSLAHDSEPVCHEEILDALGTFSIVGDDGEFSVYGPTAASEYLIREDPRLLPSLMQEMETPMRLPADIVLLSALFPFPPSPLPLQKMDDFVPHLPSFAMANTLANYYFTHFAWCEDPVPRSLFSAHILRECYPGDEPAVSLRHISPHIVSILFMVFAMGALAHVDNPHPFVAAEEFHTLARACLCVQPAYENPTVWAVQSMSIMLFYHMCTERRSAGYTLALWSVMARLCETLGLNHDQRKLKKGQCAEARERVFWEAMNLDSWQAFTSGRAKSLSFKVISCKRPIDHEPIPGGGYTTWKHDFATKLDSVAERAFREKGSTYSQIQALEAELRSVPIPPSIAWPDPSEQGLVLGALSESSRAVQCFMVYGSIETSLLHLHRWFFLQAIRERPENPFEHPFARSVRTVIETSHALIEGLNTIYTYQPAVTVSFRPFWMHAYSGAMVLGSLVVSCPHVPEALPALTSLDRACELFQATAPKRTQTYQSLQILLGLRAEAHRAWGERRASASQVESLGFWTNAPSPWPASTTPPTQLSPSSWDGSV